MADSSSINKEKILGALSAVVDLGRISGVTVMGGRVGFLISGDANAEELRQECEAAVKKLGGVEHVTAVLTAHDAAPAPKKEASWNREPVAGVNRIVAVASGKGGVGKSSMASLLALAAAKRGLNVGLLDADIYGPSIPTMFGVNEKVYIENNKMIPHEKYGVKLMSMGFIVGEDAAIMRAPRVTKALVQMLRQTAWGSAENPLDILYIDLPPGTGDVHLSMVQSAPIDEAVIITLPSIVSVADAKKSLQMFEKVDVPITGIIENMSYIENNLQPFGSGGGERLAADTGYKFLDKLPLDPAVGHLLNDGKNPFEHERDNSLLDKILALKI